jgi:hypothetical protein
VHIKLKLNNVDATEFVKTRKRFWNRMKRIFTEDNIIYFCYLFGLLAIILSLVAWPGDADPMSELAPPAPPAPPSPPPPEISENVLPPLPLAPPVGGAVQVEFSCAPELESAWFQPSNLNCDILVIQSLLSNATCAATHRAPAAARRVGRRAARAAVHHPRWGLYKLNAVDP